MGHFGNITGARSVLGGPVRRTRDMPRKDEWTALSISKAPFVWRRGQSFGQVACLSAVSWRTRAVSSRATGRSTWAAEWVRRPHISRVSGGWRSWGWTPRRRSSRRLRPGIQPWTGWSAWRMISPSPTRASTWSSANASFPPLTARVRYCERCIACLRAAAGWPSATCIFGLPAKHLRPPWLYPPPA